jgi:phage gpG-like protein
VLLRGIEIHVKRDFRERATPALALVVGAVLAVIRGYRYIVIYHRADVLNFANVRFLKRYQTMNPNDLMRNILSDIKVELAEMFDKNFERKKFFDAPWKPRRDVKAKDSLLLVTGKTHRSIKAAIRGGECFSSQLPYTALHNEGGKFLQRVREHDRRNFRSVENTPRAGTLPHDEYAQAAIYRWSPRRADSD